jgi:predicted DNA-binding transcriptional regulator AlpA
VSLHQQAVVLHVIDLDQYPDGTWINVDGIAHWMQMSRATLYRHLDRSEAPLVLTRWGTRKGAKARAVKAWFQRRTFGRET